MSDQIVMQQRANALELPEMFDEFMSVDAIIYLRKLACMERLERTLSDRQKAARAFHKANFDKNIAPLLKP